MFVSNSSLVTHGSMSTGQVTGSDGAGTMWERPARGMWSSMEYPKLPVLFAATETSGVSMSMSGMM